MLETGGSQGDCAPGHTVCPGKGSRVTAASGVRRVELGCRPALPGARETPVQHHVAPFPGPGPHRRGPPSLLAHLVLLALRPSPATHPLARAEWGQRGQESKDGERQKGGSLGTIPGPRSEDGTAGRHPAPHGGLGRIILWSEPGDRELLGMRAVACTGTSMVLLSVRLGPGYGTDGPQGGTHSGLDLVWGPGKPQGALLGLRQAGGCRAR